MERRHPNVANLDEVEAADGPNQGVFRSRLRGMGRSTGGTKLGATYVEVEPGAVAWPFHWHAANEEAIIVISGSGTLRIGGDRVEVRAGDYIAMTVGVPHQLQNTGPELLRYWCVSTKIDPEIAGYPDSGKIGAMTASAPGGGHRGLYLAGDAKGYFDGDPLAVPGARI